MPSDRLTRQAVIDAVVGELRSRQAAFRAINGAVSPKASAATIDVIIQRVEGLRSKRNGDPVIGIGSLVTLDDTEYLVVDFTLDSIPTLPGKHGLPHRIIHVRALAQVRAIGDKLLTFEGRPGEEVRVERTVTKVR